MINRNKRITVTRFTGTIEDDYGDITGTTSEVIQFFGKVKGLKSSTATTPLDINRKYQSRRIEIMVRTRDVSNVDIDDELSVAGDTTVWQVNQIYEVDFTSGAVDYSVIIAEENN